MLNLHKNNVAFSTSASKNIQQIITLSAQIHFGGSTDLLSTHENIAKKLFPARFCKKSIAMGKGL